jgi:hypothetical protein
MDSRRDVMGPHTHTSAILENGDSLKYEGPISNVTATIHGFKSHLRIDTCRIFVYSQFANRKMRIPDDSQASRYSRVTQIDFNLSA